MSASRNGRPTNWRASKHPTQPARGRATAPAQPVPRASCPKCQMQQTSCAQVTGLRGLARASRPPACRPVATAITPTSGRTPGAAGPQGRGRATAPARGAPRASCPKRQAQQTSCAQVTSLRGPAGGQQAAGMPASRNGHHAN
ncbi:hypothetical protein GCM10022245_58650 [Streptomyces mayteni]